jgi:hypothetical protein
MTISGCLKKAFSAISSDLLFIKSVAAPPMRLSEVGFVHVFTHAST